MKICIELEKIKRFRRKSGLTLETEGVSQLSGAEVVIKINNNPQWCTNSFQV